MGIESTVEARNRSNAVIISFQFLLAQYTNLTNLTVADGKTFTVSYKDHRSWTSLNTSSNVS